MERREFHVIGPPGTGKTHYLSEQAGRDSQRLGGKEVFIATLTKAAAVEIGGRAKGGIPPENMGTLHSHCMRAADLRGKLVLDSPAGIKQWNDWIKRVPGQEWLTLGSGVSADDPAGSMGGEPAPGNEFLERLMLCRHRQVPLEDWSPDVMRFAKLWATAMHELDATDFTQMIEKGLEMPHAPGNPRSLLLDEYQDFSRLEGAVIRQWALAAEKTIMVGDEDQVLYSWRGADPQIFSGHPVPENQRKILPQSYRVPRKVHALARQIITKVESRIDAEYLPRDEEGASYFDESARWARPEGWIDSLLKASEQGTVMLLAPCAFMLQPAIAFLRREGIPFGNPFRRNRGDWNPLGSTDGESKTAARQLMAYIGSDPERWTTDELRAWCPLLRSARHKVPLLDDTAPLRYGAKAGLTRLQEPFPGPEEYRGLWTEAEHRQEAARREIEWLQNASDEKGRKRLEFPIRVWRERGIEGLKKEPNVIIGTIHSVKGGESDAVFVLTALPQRWQEGCEDEMRRLFYVAVTRARKSVTLLCGDRLGFEV